MRIHLHTLSWNDRPMLGFFFRHYAPWVDRFYILDDRSSDGTRELLSARADVALGELQRSHPDSWVRSAQRIYDTAWKESRGEADWVVVTNIDEHLHHPSMREYLAAGLARGVTVVPALGYQMLTEEFPAPDRLLWRDHPFGAPCAPMSKAGIFRPDRIRETRFAVGRHTARFTGEVVFPARDEVVNLHYKYLGVAWTQRRHEALGARLGPLDRAQDWGHKYGWDESRLRTDIEAMRPALVDVSKQDHHTQHAEPRWWRGRTEECSAG